MAEFALLAIPLMLAGLFVVEAARWQMTRQVLSLALLEAARAGATRHGRPAVIESAFETALLPLYQPPGAHADARARMHAAFRRIRRETGMAPWRIDILQPTPEVFTDFADGGIRVAAGLGLPVIRNDYQAEQHARRLDMGWREGRGPRSGMTIFQANTLRLRLNYLHAPLVPGIRQVLRLLGGRGAHRTAAAQAGMLAMAMDLAVTMQSHPVDWSGRAHGGTLARLSPPPSPQLPPLSSTRLPPLLPAAPARSLPPTAATDAARILPLAAYPAASPGAAPAVPAPPSAPLAPAVGAAAPSGHAGATSDMEDAACGVVLCCT